MNNRKNMTLVLVVLLVIGFASVSTSLMINGLIGVGSNEGDFNIIFTSAKLNNRKRNDFIEPTEKKTLTFETDKLTILDEEAILDYEVANTSRIYDGEVVINCTVPDNDYVVVDYQPMSMIVEAGKTGIGRITARLKKVSVVDDKITIKCTLSASAIEKDSLGDEYVPPFSKSGTLMAIDWNSSEYFWGYKENITDIVFENEIAPHETHEDLIFDVSDKKDGSVMAYLVENADDTTKYTLYIESESGIKANANSAGLFYNFTSLKSIDNLKYFDTSNVINMGSMFQNCRSLTSLDLSDFDTSNVTVMTAMFYDCISLTSLDMNNFTTDKVTNMSAMLGNCKALTKVDISYFNTEKVVNMSGMFQNCNNLEILNINSFDTSNVTNMSVMFEECNKLTKLDLSNFNTSKVTNMSGMFHNCMSLVYLNIKNFDTSNVTTMNSMFYNCNNLKNLDVSSFDTSNVTTMVAMFEYCRSLTNLDLSNFNMEQLPNIEGIFHGMSSLKVLDIRKFNLANIEDGKSIFTTMPNDTIVKVRDEEVQQRILELPASDRPSAWNINNVVIAV